MLLWQRAAAQAERPVSVGLVVACGLPFSGKSTLLDAIAARTSAPVVRLDEINAEKGLDGGAGGISGAVWAQTFAEGLRRIEDHIASGAALVLADDTSCYRFLRDQYRELAARRGVRHLFLWLDVPVPVLEARVEENRRTGGAR